MGKCSQKPICLLKDSLKRKKAHCRVETSKYIYKGLANDLLRRIPDDELNKPVLYEQKVFGRGSYEYEIEVKKTI